MRSKHDKADLIDWDLNIYQSEEDNLWYITPYYYSGDSHYPYRTGIALTPAESFTIRHRDEYFDNQDDVWYGMKGFLFDKWDKMSDRIRYYLESLPKYNNDRSKV